MGRRANVCAGALDRTVPLLRGRDGALRRLPDPLPDALRSGHLLAEQQAITAALPPDPTDAIRTAERHLNDLARRRDDLRTGRGDYARHPTTQALRDHQSAQARRPPERNAAALDAIAAESGPTVSHVDRDLIADAVTERQGAADLDVQALVDRLAADVAEVRRRLAG